MEEVTAVALTQTLERKAVSNPGQPPSQILRTELLSQLPDREALAKAMRRERRRNLPTNPRNLHELEELMPERFKRMLLNERFLIYDSHGRMKKRSKTKKRARMKKNVTECWYSPRATT